MDTSDITRSYIIETARKYGFQRDTLEKVIRLYQILKDMSGIPLFRDCFALKGAGLPSILSVSTFPGFLLI